MQKQILVLRPYGADIRHRMFEILERLDIHPSDEDIVAAGLTDEEVIADIQDRSADVLLCPFNNLKLPNGELTNGLRLLQQVYQALPQFVGVPVLMPVSIFSAAVFHSKLNRGTDVGPISDTMREAILPIDESELDDREALSRRIAEHLAPLPPPRRLSSNGG